MTKRIGSVAGVAIGISWILAGCSEVDRQGVIDELSIGSGGIEQLVDGEWEVEMAQQGESWTTRFAVEGGRLECLGSGLETMVGMRGRHELIGNGVFIVQVANDTHAATQFWVFQDDGTAVVKEVPDRGENQRARRLEPSGNAEG